MAELRHLRIVGGVEGVPFRPPVGGKRKDPRYPARDRLSHARSLRAMVAEAERESEEAHRREDSPVEGVQLVVEGALGYALKVESLENRQQRIRLLQAQERDGVGRAVVFVPRESYGWLAQILDKYETQETDKGRPRYEPLVANIEAIRLAIAKDLWSDAAPFPTGDRLRWWEVWLPLDNAEPENLIDLFTDACHAAGLVTGPQWLQVGERLILLVKARPSDWTRSRRVLDMVAELRDPIEPAAPYLGLTPKEQGEHVDDLLRRLTPAHPNAPAVCLLDTGVHRGHPLLEDSLLESDWQTVDPAWGESDNVGDDQHGTLMAGTALFADLADWLSGSSFGVLSHRLESVRLLPRHETHQVEEAEAPALYGKLIEQAVLLAEIRAPYRKRVICLAATSEDNSGEGLPSSQSAAVDKVAFADGESTRLFVVSAGNVRVFNGEPYPEHNLGAHGRLEDPAQAYNALSIGAFTGRVHLPGSWPDHEPVAPRDALSPWSRTSAAWERPGDRSRWPLKPDVVFEGGNWAVDGSGVCCSCYHTELLTTAMHPTGELFDTNAATSAATAQAARLAAMIQARYPDLRAETVRGLIVHAAQWRPPMEKQVPARIKSERRRRVRVFGYGVPDIERALSSASNSVVLVHEGRIQPYTKRDSSGRNNQMMLHELPWPKAQLLNLGPVRVRMRVTLSYFIEPNPGRRGTIPKSAYASHALRFDVRRHAEELEAFIQRVNADESVRDDDYQKPDQTAADQPWVLGSKNRAAGSIHSDWWEGSAEELAGCDAVAVYPTSGWWKDRPHRGKTEAVAPYSLIVSIETEETTVDLYNMIATIRAIGLECLFGALDTRLTGGTIGTAPAASLDLTPSGSISMSRTPPTEEAYITFARQHIDVWSGGQAGPPAIGLTATQITETEAATAAAEAAFSAAIAARSASKAATEAKDNALAALKAVIGADIDTIDAFAKATRDPNVWVLAQIPSPKEASERPAPERPTDLDAVLRLNGSIEVSFKANTGGGAQYLVERQTTSVEGQTSDYTFLGFADDEKKFLDTAVPEGVKSVGYRVAARISTGLQSDWSPTFTLPFGSQGQSAQASAKAGTILPVKGEDQKGAG